ncbi:MAG TPA: hypothetical protein VFA55_05185 [Candidatus Kapabacteria bacterium]|nr:hypothetical protein [Candidatus Kapabacteria bacterium]
MGSRSLLVERTARAGTFTPLFYLVSETIFCIVSPVVERTHIYTPLGKPMR